MIYVRWWDLCGEPNLSVHFSELYGDNFNRGFMHHIKEDDVDNKFILSDFFEDVKEKIEYRFDIPLTARIQMKEEMDEYFIKTYGHLPFVTLNNVQIEYEEVP